MMVSEQTKEIQWFIKQHPNPGNVSEKDIHNFYIQLIDCLVDHNHLYYIENKPIISDKEYDEFFDYLKNIEEHFPQIITSNSPTQSLMGQISEWFNQAQHRIKLLSLENTYNAKDLEERDERIHKILIKQDIDNKISYNIEPKFDGLSVELIYKKWVFTQAITRGDGLVWEDVTENVRTIKNIPRKLQFPIDIQVRWEILMPKSVLKEINKEREEEWDIPFSNTRNAAAGSIKLLDPKEVAKRGLICYVYDVLAWSLKLEAWRQNNLEKLWFPVFPRSEDRKNIQEVIDLCENPETKKHLEQQDIEFDGLVIKIKDEHQRKIIWATEHHPRRAVAYKFPAQLAATQVLSVNFQVGRTGIITPVANLEPVQLSGAKLQRVSLHNFDFIKEKDIHIHDRIWLQRSGEVIPYIVSVITDRRIEEEREIHPPVHCHSCNEIVENIDMHYYCINPHCPEKTKQQIQHFVSKNCMDIQGIGESIVDILVENKITENIADIYTLTEQNIQIQLRKFPGFGDKKVAEIAKWVEESKHKALRRLINGLWIPHVGKKIAQDIASQMNDEWLMMNNITNTEWLRNIYGIGEKTVENMTKFFTTKHNIKILEELKKYWVNMDPKKYSDLFKLNDDIKGSFSITWSFAIPREKITEYFQHQGYIFHEQPGKTTDFMLIGGKAGSKKTKAQELWITLYEWRENISKKFPFLKGISNGWTKPQIQSLF